MVEVGCHQCQVLWVPGYHDKFVTFGRGLDVKLYKIAHVSQDPFQTPGSGGNNGVRISEKHEAVLMSRISHISYSCAALYPKADLENRVLIALGQLNGTVTVRTFDQTSVGPFDCGREFAPYHQRPCNALAWNSVNSNWLAVGLERARNDLSLVVWDIASEKNLNTFSASVGRQRSLGNVVSKMGYSNLSPDNRVIEAGSTYETTSIAWFPSEPNTLIAGQGGKFLKIFDIRDQPEYFKLKRFTNTKAVYGVCVDPNFEYRVASFVEGDQGVVLIWDIRHFEKPVSFIFMTLCPVFV